MPPVFPHHVVVRPRDALLESHTLPACPPFFAVPHVRRFWSAGDHDFVGQHQLAIGDVKRVFLAELHRVARGPADEPDAVWARALIEGRALDEPYFDERWTIEDVGMAVVSSFAVAASLESEDAEAVGEWSGGEGGGTVQARVRAARESFVSEAIAKLAAHLDARTFHIDWHRDLVCTANVVSALAEARPDLAHDEEGDLRIDVELDEESPGERLAFRLLGARRTKRTRRRIAEQRGVVRGMQARDGDGWEVWMETVVRTPL